MSSALVDAAGTEHGLAGADARIVSLVPSLTELVCDLGLADRLVGRTGFCVHPREIVRRVPKVGGTKSVKIERVRELAPTHVLLNMDENTRETAQALAEFVPHLVVTHPLAPEDNPALYRLIGGIFGRAREAQELCRRFEEALSRLRRAAAAFAPERVLYLIWKKPWMTVARDTYVSRTLALAHWHTLPGDAAVRYPEVALEGELLAQTERILLASEPWPFREKDAAELRALPELSAKSIVLIDGEMTSWYGSRAIAAMDYLAEFREHLARGTPLALSRLA